MDVLNTNMANPSFWLPVFSPEGGEYLESFKNHMRDKWTGETVDGRRYVRTKRMIDWMKTKEANHPIENGGLLLDDVYDAAPNLSSGFHPIEWKNISNDNISNNNCIIMFGLLVVLGYGHLVHVFKQRNIQDYLPKSGAIVEQDMLKGSFKTDADLQQFMDDFERRRFEFSAVGFDLDMDKALDDGRYVLPFCRKQQINHKGATAKLYEVAVEEDFVQEGFRMAIQGTRYKDSVFGTCFRFAFKSYSEECQDIYNIERNAFKGIGNEQNMIKYLGTVQCVGGTRNPSDLGISLQRTSYNILLEYGENDLDEYFIVHSPPTLGREILDFWEKLFEIADALRRVHNLEKKRNNGNSVRFDGCHADVKPDNILRVEGNFKLADFGFATFVPRDAGPICPVGGTETYGAPEFFQTAKRSANGNNGYTVTNTIDTWSFACVVSVAATWVVLGMQGIKLFEAVRKDAIKRIKSSLGATTQEQLCSDTFHDGSAVLEDVTNWHRYLRQVMRKSDPISHQLLDLIDNEVLGQDPDNRLTSATLYDKLVDLLLRAKRNISDQIPDSIIESMISFDRMAPSTMKEYEECEQQQKYNSRTQGQEGYDSKRAKKSARLTNIVPAKVAHRQALEASLSQSSLLCRHSRQNSTSNYSLLVDVSSATAVAGPQEHYSEALGPPPTSKIPNLADIPIYKTYSSLNSRHRFKIGPLARPKEDTYLSNIIEGRDIKFIVDNGTSMKEHFTHATMTLLVLAEMVAASDKDGVDLMFTFGDNQHGCQNVKNPWRKFSKAMKTAGDCISTDPQKPFATDMTRTLGKVFEMYERNRSKQRMTVIILTDGVWRGSTQANEVEEKIAQFFKQSKKTNGFQDRPFTIEFVSFGDQATDRLNALDDDMEKKYGIPDAIDHEPWTGNPYKMILGSHDKKFDATPTSPSGNQQDIPSLPPWSSSTASRRPSARSTYEVSGG